jgi:hypothetical protein
MRAQSVNLEGDAAEGAFPDWERARGLRTFDRNCHLLMARTSVEKLAGAIAEVGADWRRDVLGRPVVVGRDSLFVFRLTGHRWSIAASRMLARTPYGRIGYEWDRAMSLRLGQPVLLYGRSDTCGSIGYTRIEGGEVVEDFYAEEGEEGRPAPRSSYMESTLPGHTLGQVGNIYAFVEDLFIDLDAFDPGIDFGYFFGHAEPRVGESRAVENPGFVSLSLPNWEQIHSTPQLERVDFLTLRRDS